MTKEWRSWYQGLRSWGDAVLTGGPSGPATGRSGSPPGRAGTTPTSLMLHPGSGHCSLNGCLLHWDGGLSEPARDRGAVPWGAGGSTCVFPHLKAEDTGCTRPETVSNECPRAPIRSGSGPAGEVTGGPPGGSPWSPFPGGPSTPQLLSLAAGMGREGVMLMRVTSSSSSCCRSTLMGTLPIIPGSQSVWSSSEMGVCNVKHNFEEGTSSTKLANSELSHTVLCNHKEY